jgi:hypothetical protein
MNQFIIVFCLSFLMISSSQAGPYKGLSIGASAGYSNYNTITAEGFVQFHYLFSQLPADAKAGIKYLPYNASFQERNDLETESWGFFVEAVVYPFKKYLYAGLRWELFTFNWLTDKAIEKLAINKSSIAFSGANLYGLIGLDIPVSDRIVLKMYAMPGIQTYNISDGSFTSGSYSMDSNKIIENHYKFAFQINAGLSIRIFKK